MADNIRIGYGFQFQLTDVRTDSIPNTKLIKHEQAFDIDGNEIDAYYYYGRTISITTFLHNEESITFAEFHKRWKEYCDEHIIHILHISYDTQDNTITFQGEAYNKPTLDRDLEHVQKFLKRMFYVWFDVNN